MGVETKLYISNRWNVKDICDVISLRFGVRTDIKFHDWAPDYMTVHFKLPQSENGRMLHVHTDSMVGGFKAIQMNFRSNPEGCKILETLAETFGGLFQESDTTDDFKEFRTNSNGEVDFIVNEALKSDPKLGRDFQQMARFIANEGWKENLTKVNKSEE
jgi:hypothetical protein